MTSRRGRTASSNFIEKRSSGPLRPTRDILQARLIERLQPILDDGTLKTYRKYVHLSLQSNVYSGKLKESRKTNCKKRKQKRRVEVIYRNENFYRIPLEDALEVEYP
ncbi:hypothetical protein EVAR_649_1 [Eumeta japonica]|uniref:Uncharacterized protein n=1 Tax=Eumeta variegata TaxID=151549 RepID=A0A4C1SBB1_EUMVA|nr:hypothetical protein EVAR_649_1 [Eumeta japonica]